MHRLQYKNQMRVIIERASRSIAGERDARRRTPPSYTAMRWSLIVHPQARINVDWARPREWLAYPAVRILGMRSDKPNWSRRSA